MGGTCGTSRAAGGRAPLLLLRQKGGPEAGEGRAAAAWDGAAAGRSTRGKAAAAASGRQARWRDRSGEEQTEVVETAVACGKVSQLQRLPKVRTRHPRAKTCAWSAGALCVVTGCTMATLNAACIAVNCVRSAEAFNSGLARS